jgi:CDP-diacylglycerol--glycerol-3-phosphate 3-phosphatidyltransferase
MDIDTLRERGHDLAERLARPFARALMAARVTPNQVSGAAVALNIVAAGLVLDDALLAAGIVYLCAGSLDLLDGTLARLSNQVSAGGAFLDSTLDRISEGVLFAAIAYHFSIHGEPINAALAVLALLFSLLVSYTRARAEALGSKCTVGVATRAERVVLMAAGLAFGLLDWVIWLMVVVTAVSVAQRIVHTLRELGPPPARPETPRTDG